MGILAGISARIPRRVSKHNLENTCDFCLQTRLKNFFQRNLSEHYQVMLGQIYFSMIECPKHDWDVAFCQKMAMLMTCYYGPNIYYGPTLQLGAGPHMHNQLLVISYQRCCRAAVIASLNSKLKHKSLLPCQYAPVLLWLNKQKPFGP